MEKPSATTGAAHNAGEEEPVEHWWRKYQERRSARQQERSSGKSDDPPVIRPMVCAAPWSFVCRGTAQGQRDHRPLPHRFARPPVRTNRRTHKVGPPVHQSVFSLGPAAARSLFGAVKKRMGADPHGAPQPLRPAGALISACAVHRPQILNGPAKPECPARLCAPSFGLSALPSPMW